MLPVDFPWMDIDDRGTADSQKAPEEVFRQEQWIQPQIPPTAEGHVDEPYPFHGQGNLPDIPVPADSHFSRKDPEFRPPVTIVPDGIHAAAVSKTFVQQNIIGPLGPFDDREGGCPIS